MQLDNIFADAIEAMHKGYLIAYTSSHFVGKSFRLSIVRDGESGHYPISEDAFLGTEKEAVDEARRLNKERLKLPLESEAAIIIQSMRNR